VRRFAAPVIAALLAVGLIVPAGIGAAAPVAAASSVPKVVIVVGPSGDATDRYRSEARAAAAVARGYTPDVVELYSPNATWPAVSKALDGASVVIYMGHGNGWPSRYRDALYPITQDGFGLNPVAGGDDYTHQYFGEAAIGSEVKLARNAVVLLNHLCYASGNSEPGLPEGTLPVAKQRVDNFAAGFIQAGAAAVVAEAWSSPNYMLRAVLGGDRSIEKAWRQAPSANGHRLAFASQRSPGFVAEMDTETASSGFTRSIVLKRGLAPAAVLAGSRGSAVATAPIVPSAPSLAGGVTFQAPDIRALTSAGTTVMLGVHYTLSGAAALPKGMQVSVRWDPLDTTGPVAAQPGTEVAPTGPAAAGASPDPTASPAPSPDAAASPAEGAAASPAAGNTGSATAAAPATTEAAPPATTPAATPKPATKPRGATLRKPPTGLKPTPIAPPLAIDPPPAALDLVVAERVGDVVAPAPVKIGKSTIGLKVALPAAPGRYRLTVTLHDPHGVVYDAPTQALVPTVTVRVTGDFDGAILATPSAELTAGSTATLPVRVVNLGRMTWGLPAIVDPGPIARVGTPAMPASLVGRWIPLSDGASVLADPATAETRADLPIGLASGATADATLALTAPDAPGDYLVMLDVVTPERGSLIAAGWQPTLVRVTVVAGP
jgi:hypothetical protein